jgi:hypothetical protein
MAYCTWLQQQLAGSDWPVSHEGKVVALGDLLAGGGPAHRRYPWGQDFAPE